MHACPVKNGDIAAVGDKALDERIAALEKKKRGVTKRPQKGAWPICHVLADSLRRRPPGGKPYSPDRA